MGMLDGPAFDDDGARKSAKPRQPAHGQQHMGYGGKTVSIPLGPASPFALTPPPTMKRREGKAYVWVSWLTALLAGESHCEYATWLRAHYSIEKRIRTGPDLSAWKAAHARQVQTSLAAFVALGYTCTLEDQNSLKIVGDRGILAGKPDLVALSKRDPYGLVVDEKTGRRKDADIWQVLIYMLFLPRMEAYRGLQFRGQINYKQGPPVNLTPADLTPQAVDAIHQMCRRVMENDPPAVKVPSVRECDYCDVRPEDCPENLAGKAAATASTDDF